MMEEMQSPDIGKLAEALAKAQSEMEGAKKDAANPFFKSDYATLFSVWQACRGPLTKNGLSIIQTTGNGGDNITVYTILAHSSGQWIKGALSIRPGKTDPQTLGSCITYLRRYALAGMVGLSPLDDDAEAAMAQERKQPPKPQPKPPAKTPETNSDAKSSMKAYLASMAKAKAVLKEMTGSDEIYYAALKSKEIEHANEIKTVADGEKILSQLRAFVKRQKEGGDAKKPDASGATGDDGAEFPPAES